MKEEWIHNQWLIKARYENQQFLHKLYEYNQTEMDVMERKIFNLLIGAAFSLWRAAPLINFDRTAETVKEKANFLLKKLIKDNAINYIQDIASCEWMSGFYLNNVRLRLLKIKEDLTFTNKVHNKIDFSPIENNRVSDISNLCEHWNTLHSISLNIFELFYTK